MRLASRAEVRRRNPAKGDAAWRRPSAAQFVRALRTPNSAGRTFWTSSPDSRRQALSEGDPKFEAFCRFATENPHWTHQFRSRGPLASTSRSLAGELSFLGVPKSAKGPRGRRVLAFAEERDR
jgi:hypothetical protein